MRPLQSVAAACLAALLSVAMPARGLAAADPAKVLRLVFPVAETGFDPVRVHDLYSNIVVEAIFERLVGYDYLARPPQLVAPAWGVRSESEPQSLSDRCLALATGLHDRFAFSHLTAARLHDLPISHLMEADDRLHVVRQTLDGSTRRPGVAGHRGLEAREVGRVKGVPVTSLADT